MKQIKTILICVILASPLLQMDAQNLSAKEIIVKADNKMRGTSSESTITMKIVRPTWERTVTFRSWEKDRKYSLTLITAPAKEKGQTFLKRDTEMWNWIPNISRLVKIPPSMLSQGWMGSDYTNDDILKESSIVVDYIHTIIGDETISGNECYKIKLIQKEDAAGVWGNIITWVSKEEFLQLKSTYFDEDGYLVKTETASEIKMMDDRKIPTYMEIIPEDDPGHKTIVIINTIKFNTNIADGFFSQQNMKRVR
ncbi:MAG: outer membrane lipoprotein-sorting protein [Bacteroidales bacterium]|nr:outer membrane lipoprotein-sorting protein [Bacteroidales bacterium]